MPLFKNANYIKSTGSGHYRIDEGVSKCSNFYIFGGVLGSLVPIGFSAKGAIGAVKNMKLWLKYPWKYEVAKKTVKDDLYELVKNKSISDAYDVITSEIGMVKTLFDLRGNWREALNAGPTPDALLGSYSITGGLAWKFFGSINDCECK